MNKQLKERSDLIDRILNMKAREFDSLALKLFHYQYKYNDTYQKYVELIGVHPDEVLQYNQIPFLPIQMFKNHVVSCFPQKDAIKVFRSSTTTGQQASQHYIYALDLYHDAILKSFESATKSKAKDFQWLGLLPSYLERDDASLVEMVSFLNQHSSYSLENPFFLNEYSELNKILKNNVQENIPTILVGVTFAILDWIETTAVSYPQLTLVETGGMKGKRKEMTRDELHDKIQSKLTLKNISSEYGMTELMSQAYWTNGQFYSPVHMRVTPRDISDPLNTEINARSVALNVIDLMNIDSCAFIATDDVGEIFTARSFNVLGRLDASDIRGCNLMVV